MQKYWCVSAALGAMGALAFSATVKAEVVGTGTGQQDTAAPITSGSVTISGWNNVGLDNGDSAVYLGQGNSAPGEGWVITAAHVGAPALGTYFTLNGTQYAFDGTQYQLDTPSTYGTASPQGTDLVVFQISAATAPSVSALTLASSEPTNTEEIYSVGYGYSRAVNEALTYYSVTGSGTNATWSVTSQGSANAAGYQWNDGGVKFWGNNNVTTFNGATGAYGGTHDPVVNTFTVNGMDVQGFVTEFYTSNTVQVGGDTAETQIAQGDSGGAVFNDSGQLIGINDADLDYVTINGNVDENQPGGTAILGNGSEYVDLYEYENQIEDLTGVPEPASVSVLFCAAAALLTRRRRGAGTE